MGRGSRIVENVDDIYIPYFDTQSQIYRKFYPDFIFWLKDRASGIESIYFIDPKGLTCSQNSIDKIKGFESIFKVNGKSHNDIKVYLYYYNNKNPLDGYNDYVRGSITDIFI
ncbi:restriction endonuclease subunit R [Campylobacter sp. MG1]|uniref:restriction endonuclease subunit R n=1 Tax=Campylobacter sp. MG1 TaxID=2976332 RepID=UPI00226CBD59|nr:restriction endonuclease subunit R [Campylobacter sp. MG1]